jgi:hypothetical protein
MKILFVSTYYPDFLNAFYIKHGKMLEKLSFQRHTRRVLDELFAGADFYSAGVKNNGHQAFDLIANDKRLQMKWSQENGVSNFNSLDLFSKTPYLQVIFKPDWVYKILEAQANTLSVDIVYFHNIEYFSPRFIRELKKNYFIIAQKASPIRRMCCFKEANLVFTSFPHFLPIFRSKNITAEYLKLAFGKRVLKSIPKQKKIYNCTFVGGISRYHSSGVKILSEVAKKEKLDIFGYGKSYLKKRSELYKMYRGEAWGREMYKVMMQSNMTINRHIDVAGQYANNMRMFEATGSGTLLLTDDRVNNKDFFKVGEEMVVYKSSEDLIDKIKYFSLHSRDREKIAKNGQARTLKDHSYEVRMKEMLHLLEKYY